MSRKSLFLMAFGLLMILFWVPAFAYIGPVAAQTEWVKAHYNTNGSLTGTTFTECPDDSNPCRFGYIEVALPNRNDTLQTVRVNLTGTTGTNLNSAQTYMSAVSSPTALWSRTKMYVNDSVFGSDQNYYKITDVNLAPVIALNLTSYGNVRGGSDIYDYDNVGPGGSINNMSFVLTAKNPSASKNLNPVTVQVYFDTNSRGTSDSINLTYTSAGSVSSRDGADGFNDLLTWSGTINAGATQTITFYGNIAETINIAAGATNMNLDYNFSNQGARSNHTGAAVGTFTVNNISKVYARGPVRQGVDLAERSGGGAWDVRGFFQVLGVNTTQVTGTVLTYNISAWGIYNVSAATGNMGNSLQSGTFSPTNFTSNYGRLYTTDSDFSSNTSRVGLTGAAKPYVASSFIWNVYWNNTFIYNASYINSTLNLPNLYKIDQSLSKTVAGVLIVGSSTVFNVTNNVTYLGDTNAKGRNITIIDSIPRNTTGGALRTAFSVDGNSVIVRWYNGAAWTTLKTGTGTTNGVTVTVTQPSGTNNGTVSVSIPNLSATLAATYLDPNDQISVFYNITSPEDLQTGDAYNFTGNSTILTVSGTPEAERFTLQAISSSARQLIGYKDLFSANPASPTLVNGTLVAQVIGNSISGIYFVDYIPNGTNFTCVNTSIKFYNSTDGITFSSSSDYSVTNKGYLTLPDGTVVLGCEIKNYAGTGWTLNNNKAVKVMYMVNITHPGLYEVPAGIAGFDPSTGEEFQTTVYGIVRIEVPVEMAEPKIRQGDFLVTRTITVGNPVIWIKDFEVYNPNSQFVDSKFSTEVFNDATTGYVSYIDESGKEVNEDVVFTLKDDKRRMVWNTRLYPQETRNYDVRIITPPVMETSREVEVTGLFGDKQVELRMSIFLTSLAEEIYKNVQLNIPVSSASILDVSDGEGNKLSYSGTDSVRVTIPEMASKALEEIILKYKDTYPRIIVTPSRESYDLDSEVSLDILVIHGGEQIDYPYIETEVYTSDKELVYANIRQLDKLDPISKTNISERFRVPLGATSGKYVAEARLRTDMDTLAVGTGNFYVSGTESAVAAWMSYLMLVIALGVLYFGVKRIKSVQSETSESSATEGSNGAGISA